MVFFYSLMALFTLSEVLLLISKKSKKDAAKSQRDDRSLLYLWLTIPICLTLGSLISFRQIGLTVNPYIFTFMGAILIVIGFIVRWLAIVQLGKMFTVDVSISHNHMLKTDGLYTIVRHPSYTGLMLIIAGLAVFLGDLLSLIIIIAPVFYAVNNRIKVEERSLMEEFGSQYQAYKSRVKKIIPCLY